MFARALLLCLCMVLGVELVTGQCTAVIRRGSRGECVKVAQRAAGTSADGIFGAGTEAAVKAFQRSKGLVADGIIGARTWAAIYAAERCSAVIRRGSRGDCVKVAQRAVGTGADGIFGAGTEAAVKAYQRRKGLVADGIIGRSTWAAIYGSSPPSGGGGGGGGGNSCGCSSQKATGCSSGPTQGARNLAAYLKARYGGRTEIYNCRQIRGGSGYSLHAEGRAVDLYVSKAVGDRAMAHLKTIACKNGIQEIIWYRRIWTASGERAYGGTHPHTDHVHVGLNRCGATDFNL